MTTIWVCTTCRRGEAADPASTPDGETWLETVAAAAAEAPDVEVRGQPCLMGCSHGCNAAVMAEGKMTYVLGDFEPTAEAAAAVVAYARQVSESESGVVPYRQWPEGVKGHFVARVPPTRPIS